ncbi:hypothetical protein Rai3103_14150 [Raineyella fluvialis]|uniref:Phosphatidylethanolamine-binding protein n=1 Tax=Raineyella fluvialis TaxID=2662261 RepID=A0A5Q2FIW2_9ACTN|nr:hypothetical protein Rai3103_14150 [Raineyella fluvialis]
MVGDRPAASRRQVPGGRCPTGRPGDAEQWPAARLVPALSPSGTHRYVFAVYALDAVSRGSSTQHVLDEIADHTVAWGSVTGLVRAH